MKPTGHTKKGSPHGQNAQLRGHWAYTGGNGPAGMCIAPTNRVSAGLIHSGRQVEAATPERYSRSKKRITRRRRARRPSEGMDHRQPRSEARQASSARGSKVEVQKERSASKLRAWWRDFQDSRRDSSQDEGALIGRALQQHKLHFSEVYGLRRVAVPDRLGWPQCGLSARRTDNRRAPRGRRRINRAYPPYLLCRRFVPIKHNVIYCRLDW